MLGEFFCKLIHLFLQNKISNIVPLGVYIYHLMPHFHQREDEGFSSCVGDIGSPLMMPEGGGRFYAQVIMISLSIQIMIKMILGHI